MRERNETAAVPGAVIAKQMRFMKMNETELAGLMGISKNQVQKLITGEARLTNAVAVKLEKALGLPAEFWNNLEEVYRDKLEGK